MDFSVFVENRGIAKFSNQDDSVLMESPCLDPLAVYKKTTRLRCTVIQVSYFVCII